MSLLLLFQPPYNRILRDQAQGLHRDGQYQAAVVIAQAACEIVTELAFDALYREKGVEALAEPMGDLFRAYDLRNERLRAVYNALAGYEIQKDGIWSKYDQHVRRRQRVVHRGEQVTESESQESLQAVDDFIDHMDERIRRLQTS